MMFGSGILDVAIGLVFIYLLLSLICSAAKEGLEALMKKRAIDLERGIKEMLDDQGGTGLAKEIYDHPLVAGMFKGTFDDQKGGRFWSNLPSYIPAKNFALALTDVIARSQPGAGALPMPGNEAAPVPPAVNLPAQAALNQAAQQLQSFRNAINGIQNNDQVKQALLTLVGASGGDMDQARANIEAWFNSSMDRVAGWYKRWCQWVIFGMGGLLVLFLNADTIGIANDLAREPALRQSLTAAAQEAVKKQPGDDKTAPQQRLKQEVNELQKLGLPLGWDSTDPRVWPEQTVWGWVTKAIGLLMTALALSLGAPFWFDLLNKFMVVRSTVKPDEKSPKEKAKD